jgi:ABC-type multidrug transport system fused ATPase/permease subunit
LAQKYTRPRNKWNSKTITLAEEAISNIRAVTVFNRQERESERYHNAEKMTSHHKAVVSLCTSISRSLIDLVGRCLTAVYIDFGAISILNKDVTAGDVLAAVRALYTDSFGISSGLQQSMRQERNLESANCIFDYTQRPKQLPRQRPVAQKVRRRHLSSRLWRPPQLRRLKTSLRKCRKSTTRMSEKEG